MGERASCPTGPRSTAIPPSLGTLKPLPWKPWRSLSNRPWPTSSGRIDQMATGSGEVGAPNVGGAENH